MNKEPKRYKLNLNSPSHKEPLKIPLKPNSNQNFDEEIEKQYDIYYWDPLSVYTPKDLEIKK